MADVISKLSRLETAQHSFEEIAVSRRYAFNVTGAGDPERYSGFFVTASYFRVLKGSAIRNTRKIKDVFVRGKMTGESSER